MSDLPTTNPYKWAESYRQELYEVAHDKAARTAQLLCEGKAEEAKIMAGCWQEAAEAAEYFRNSVKHIVWEQANELF